MFVGHFGSPTNENTMSSFFLLLYSLIQSLPQAHWLPTADMAARAYDVAAIALRGRSACLNFADSAWRLPVPASADPKDIQKTAAEAAEAFRPSEEEAAEASAAASAASQENMFSMDEEVGFGMHGLLTDMAEGLMLPPPQYNDDVETNADVSLWSYSI